MVGANGFEPSTPWSRTSLDQTKSVELTAFALAFPLLTWRGLQSSASCGDANRATSLADTMVLSVLRIEANRVSGAECNSLGESWPRCLWSSRSFSIAVLSSVGSEQ